MLQVTNLEKSFGKQLLFDGVSFTVNPRERVGLVGRNGHGKSTLFRMILGEEHQDSGTITTPSGVMIDRFVYVYLIYGTNGVCLIDSGVASASPSATLAARARVGHIGRTAPASVSHNAISSPDATTQLSPVLTASESVSM